MLCNKGATGRESCHPVLCIIIARIQNRVASQDCLMNFFTNISELISIYLLTELFMANRYKNQPYRSNKQIGLKPLKSTVSALQINDIHTRTPQTSQPLCLGEDPVCPLYLIYWDDQKPSRIGGLANNLAPFQAELKGDNL